MVSTYQMIRHIALELTLQDWMADKERSKFALQALCWEQSCIPHNIWTAADSTSNVIEALHSDVNREGVNYSLVAGYIRGREFDYRKDRSHQVYFSNCRHISRSEVLPY